MGFLVSAGKSKRTVSIGRFDLHLVLLMALIAQIALAAGFTHFLPLEPGITAVGTAEKSATPLRTIESLVATSRYKRLFTESFNSASGDGSNYMLMAKGEKSYPPYSLRPVMPFVVGTITSVFVSPRLAPGDFYCIAQLIMIMMNVGLLVPTALLTFKIARRYCTDEAFCGLLAVISVVNYSVLQTAPFFMLEVASIFMATLTVHLVLTKRYLAAAAALALGVLTKEVLIIFALLFVLPVVEGRLRIAKAFVYAMCPLAAFVGLRVGMGADPLSMQYGWHVSQGQFSLEYIRDHFRTPFHALACLSKLGLGLGVVGGIAAAAMTYPRRKAELWVMAAVTVLVIVAILLLGGRVIRVLQVSYPVVVLGAAIGWHRMFPTHSSQDGAALPCEVA